MLAFGMRDLISAPPTKYTPPPRNTLRTALNSHKRATAPAKLAFSAELVRSSFLCRRQTYGTHIKNVYVAKLPLPSSVPAPGAGGAGGAAHTVLTLHVRFVRNDDVPSEP